MDYNSSDFYAKDSIKLNKLINQSMNAKMQNSIPGGLGVDIVSVNRIKKILERTGDAFLKQVFTADEIKYGKMAYYPEERFAGMIAIKEAYFKSIRKGFKEGFFWKWVTISYEKAGNPQLHISNKIYAKWKLENHSCLVSVSHEKDHAVAVVICFNDKN